MINAAKKYKNMMLKVINNLKIQNFLKALKYLKILRAKENEKLRRIHERYT
jgi:hypothetical protein